MESYTHTLIYNIGKIYYIPHHRSPKYANLYQKLFNILNRLALNKINRQQATELFSQVLYELEKLPPKNSSIETDRTDERISIIVDMLKSIKLIPKNILDVGAGTGDITSALKIYYNLPGNMVFAIDKKLPDVSNITPLIYNNGNIPLPDDSIDLIIMFVVLHHIPPNNREKILSEITRVLSPNGAFIIREHDADGTLNFNVFIDMLHIFWYLVYNENPDPLYLMTRNETFELLTKFGLKSKLYSTYSGPNPQRLYHELFIKPKIVYKFVDDIAQTTLQNYIDKIRVIPHTYESFINVVPHNIRSVIYTKYNFPHGLPISNVDLQNIWSDIIKEIALAIILKAASYSSIYDEIRYITSSDISRAIFDL